MSGVLCSATPSRSARAKRRATTGFVDSVSDSLKDGLRDSVTASTPWVRWLITVSVALALASAPTMGVAWSDVMPGNSSEPGAAAGVVPFVADPGHRMGAASFGASAPSGAGSFATHAYPTVRSDAAGDRPGVVAPHHRWLRTMLAGARLQTDGA